MAINKLTEKRFLMFYEMDALVSRYLYHPDSYKRHDLFMVMSNGTCPFDNLFETFLRYNEAIEVGLTDPDSFVRSAVLHLVSRIGEQLQDFNRTTSYGNEDVLVATKAKVLSIINKFLDDPDKGLRRGAETFPRYSAIINNIDYHTPGGVNIMHHGSLMHHIHLPRRYLA